MINALVMILLFLSSTFLVLLVLVQRGRGGGLAGAFGGLGGQSAFGTKAGDLFTRITIVVAAFWIILCAASVKLLSEGSRSVLSPNLGKSSAPAPEATGAAPKSTAPGATGPKAKATEPAAEAKAEAKAEDVNSLPVTEKPAAAPAASTEPPSESAK
jgi:preprotein translocase subunit SecG